jgi:hypothetical protein
MFARKREGRKWKEAGLLIVANEGMGLFVAVHFLSYESVITNGPVQYHIVIYSEIVK